MHPARGRHRLAPQLTALRPLRRRTTGVAQKATPGVGCSLDPSPAAPSPGRLTAHGALGCSPPPPRVPAPPRLPPPCLTRALWRGRARVSGTDGAATAPAVAAPPLRRARPHSGKILPRSGAQSQDALRRRHALPRCLSVCVQLPLPCGATSAAPRKRGALLRPPSPSSRPGPALAPPTQSAVAPRLNQHPSRGHAGPCGR